MLFDFMNAMHKTDLRYIGLSEAVNAIFKSENRNSKQIQNSKAQMKQTKNEV
jgi:hypothetical protein